MSSWSWSGAAAATAAGLRGGRMDGQPDGAGVNGDGDEDGDMDGERELLATTPASELTFRGSEESAVQRCALTLTNLTDAHVAFRVKTTAHKVYFVAPNRGLIAPAGSVQIIVSRNALMTEGSNKDKFLILSKKVAANVDPNGDHFTDATQGKTFDVRLRAVVVVDGDADPVAAPGHPPADPPAAARSDHATAAAASTPSEAIRASQVLAQERAALARERAQFEAERAHHQQTAAELQQGIDAELARLQALEEHVKRDRASVDDAERMRTAQQRAAEARAAAALETKRAAAAAAQAEVLSKRRTDERSYSSKRDAVAAAWALTAVTLADCPVCVRRIAPGQSVLLGACLHTVCRDCAPHLLQPPSRTTVRCPICQAESTVAPDALPYHPFLEAELASEDAASSVCAVCAHLPEEDRLPVAAACTSCAPPKPLCDAHATNHRIRMQTHTVAPLPYTAAALQRCAVHDQPVAAYCSACKTLACLACMMSTHQAHRVHLLTDHTAAQAARARLVAGVATARATAAALVDHAADVAVAATELDERDAALQADVDRAMDVLVGVIEQRRAAMHAQRLARTQAERTLLEQAREMSEYHWRMATSAADVAEQLATGAHLGANATTVLFQLEAAATARLDAVAAYAPRTPIPAPSILHFDFDEAVAEQLVALGRILQL